jgi:uncharacterized protein YdeI (YjbR/CyaY-like superfamily)
VKSRRSDAFEGGAAGTPLSSRRRGAIEGGAEGAPFSGHPEPVAPQDLQLALAADPDAAVAFAALPPSHRREYIDWIVQARRAQTRARRIEQTVQMLTRRRDA